MLQNWKQTSIGIDNGFEYTSLNDVGTSIDNVNTEAISLDAIALLSGVDAFGVMIRRQTRYRLSIR